MNSQDESRDILRQAWRREIGEQIRQARKGRGMTQTQLAKIVGITQPHVVMIEKGDVNASIDTIGLIASALAATITISNL